MKNIIKKKLHEMVETHEDGPQNYMFFNNIKTIYEATAKIMQMDQNKLDEILIDSNWALDHIAIAKDDIDQVCHFLEAQMDRTGHENLVQNSSPKIDSIGIGGMMGESKNFDNSKKNSIFEQKNMTPEVKPEVKPKKSPNEPFIKPVKEPSRKDKPFLPNVTPGIKTDPKAKK
jgi:hypothetical protein